MSDGTLVVAQGTFDVLHPGHVHYLERSAERGDRLVVIVSRASNVTHKDPPILPAAQRRDVVGALAAVDQARTGHPSDIFAPIEALEPDVITLGYDQHHDPAAIEDELRERGLSARVERVGPYEGEEGLYSTGDIIDRILERYG